jgi:hypothetical protein
VQEAASTPSRQASLAVARGGAMVRHDGTGPPEHGMHGTPGASDRMFRTSRHP